MLASIFILTSLFYSVVRTQDNRDPDPNNQFIYPPLPGPQASNDPSVFASNVNFTVGVAASTPWKWTTNMTNMMITMNQEGNPESVQSRLILDCPIETDYYYWDGEISPIDLKNGSIAFLSAWNCSEPDATPIFFSHYFNLTEPAGGSSSSSSAQSSATGSIASTQSVLATQTGVTTVTASGSGSSTPTGSSSASGSTNSSGGGDGTNAAAIGGGVGGGIGGALVLIALGAFFLYWRRNKKTQQNLHNPQHGGEMGFNNQGYGGPQTPGQLSSIPPYSQGNSYYDNPQRQYAPAELGNTTTHGVHQIQSTPKFEMSDTSHSQSGRASRFGEG